MDSKNPRGFKVIFQKQTCFVSCFLAVDVFYFLMLPHPTSIGIRALTYPGLVVDVLDGSNFDDRKLSKNYVMYN